jgi:hypothetical protein
MRDTRSAPWCASACEVSWARTTASPDSSCERQDAAVHGDLAAGKAPGVHRFGIVDERDLPLIAGWKFASAASAIRFATRCTIAVPEEKLEARAGLLTRPT